MRDDGPLDLGVYKFVWASGCVFSHFRVLHCKLTHGRLQNAQVALIQGGVDDSGRVSYSVIPGPFTHLQIAASVCKAYRMLINIEGLGLSTIYTNGAGIWWAQIATISY
jgi:tRNA A37 threonylcarbamoyladenosine modification protein TsaB